MKEVQLTYESLGLATTDIFHEMRYGIVMPGEEIATMIEGLQVEVSHFTVPMYAYRLLDGEVRKTSVFFEDGSVMEVGPIISSLLKNSFKFALFVATAGNAFQEYQEAIKKEDDILKSFIVDVIGTCIVERTGDWLELSLKERIGTLKHTNRFSPGYCGWHLSYQQLLFSMMGESPCGIKLSDVFLMQPIKSISGIIGIGTQVNEKKYGCQYCDLEICYKRKR